MWHVTESPPKSVSNSPTKTPKKPVNKKRGTELTPKSAKKVKKNLNETEFLIPEVPQYPGFIGTETKVNFDKQKRPYLTIKCDASRFRYAYDWLLDSKMKFHFTGYLYTFPPYVHLNLMNWHQELLLTNMLFGN